MLKLKELTNRVYGGSDGKQCVRFEYEVIDADRAETDAERYCFIARYVRSNINSLEWQMQIVLPRNRDADSQVYTFSYILPRDGMSLTLVAAIGLKYFQLRLKEEVQQKSSWDFVLGSLIKEYT